MFARLVNFVKCFEVQIFLLLSH